MLRRGGALLLIVGVVLAVILIGAVATLVIHGREIPKKEAGPLEELGTFDAGAVVVREVVGDVQITEANVSGVVVKSNLPVNVSYSDGLLTVYCQRKSVRELFRYRETNACNEYVGGKVVIEVGKRLADVWVRETVGNVSVNVNATRLVFEDIVGDVSASAPAEYMIEDVVGDVSIRAEGDVTVKDVVGDVYISVPASFSVQLSVENIVGNVENTHPGSGKPVLVRISHVIGDVKIGQ
ncbi:hypothetical protein A3L11_00685 [Thermococcus siculi]|uniref:Adhesin domain-containing protein n=1 Tax=Thermococcus siculi TaxID=72803 RepID=A0A2Z2MHI3_9EURY|nr:hypothetical protein [Thermococcus siculi]ASJ07819.1 hypothetical protein A3L11_00685 [Thermococcus siculi]